jgi:hypothetical protein
MPAGLKTTQGGVPEIILQQKGRGIFLSHKIIMDNGHMLITIASKILKIMRRRGFVDRAAR